MRFWIGRSIGLGFRSGVSFDVSALFNRLRRSSPTAGGAGSFVYVVSGDHRLTKIGVSTNPNSRIASLQTGSPFRLDFEYIGMTVGNGFDIEQLAHETLDRHRCEGEWFDVPPEMAVAAVHAAAHKLGYALVPVAKHDVDKALRSVLSKQSSNPLTKTGTGIVLMFAVSLVVVNNIYEGHIVSILIVAALLGKFVVKPLLLRYFSRVSV